MREFLRANSTELANFAVGDRMRKPCSSRPGVSEGPNHQAREMGGRTCTEGFKESVNEGKGHLELEIFKRPPTSPGVEKERKGSRMHYSVENAKGLLLWLPWLVSKSFNEFNKNRII